MKEFLLNLIDKFKQKTLAIKTLLCSLIVLYIGVFCVCLIQVEVDSTTPGSITNVSRVINIDSEYDSGNIYTVSVYSYSKVSVLQYLLMKIDKNSSIELGQSITYDIFTENEEYYSNVGYKEQSIQDSIIVAYNAAIADGYDVSIDYNYKGQYLINIPQNLYKTGAENFKNGDIVIGYNDISFSSEAEYLLCLDELFSAVYYDNQSLKSMKENHKFDFIVSGENKIDKELILNIANSFDNDSTYKFRVIRNNEEKELSVNLKMLFYLYTNIVIKNNTLYYCTSNNFTSFNINYDNCNPKINISKSNTVGPSGGLLQTLAVYNSITENDITNGLKIMGTGGITLDGSATFIGGEQQKIVTANLYSADIFFIPSANYDSAKKMYDSLNEATFKLVSVNTFRDVLNYLNGLEAYNE